PDTGDDQGLGQAVALKLTELPQTKRTAIGERHSAGRSASEARARRGLSNRSSERPATGPGPRCGSVWRRGWAASTRRDDAILCRPLTPNTPAAIAGIGPPLPGPGTPAGLLDGVDRAHEPVPLVVDPGA